MRMLRTLLVAACLAASSLGMPAMAQEPFVIVPDFPGGGGGGGGGNAVAATTLNVRSGPGTNYPVVDVLNRGQSVRMSDCRGGWCFVEHRGRNGWASQRYLDRIGGGGGGASREACFFDAPGFRGRSFCARPGDSSRNLGAWNNRIESISIRGFVTVQVCADRNFDDCDAFNRDVARLPWWLQGNVSSYRLLF